MKRQPLTRADSNRRNAQRSTGPKTVAGKARSSQNALRHGLAVEALCPPEESPEVIATRSQAMADALQPHDATERETSDRAAFLAMRLDRCTAAETLRTSDRIRRAIADYDEALLVEVNAIALTFPRDPAGALRKLKRTPQGIDYLVDGWQDVRDILAHGTDLMSRDLERLANLLGRHPEASCFPPILMMARGAIQGDFADHPDPIFVHKKREATKISCRHKLDALIETQIDQLEAHRLTLPLAQFEQDRREAPLRAIVDLSHQGSLLRRYETAAAREIHKIFVYFDVDRPEPEPEKLDLSLDQCEASIQLASFCNSGNGERGVGSVTDHEPSSRGPVPPASTAGPKPGFGVAPWSCPL